MDCHSRENGNPGMLAPRVDFGMTAQGPAPIFHGNWPHRIQDWSIFICDFIRSKHPGDATSDPVDLRFIQDIEPPSLGFH